MKKILIFEKIYSQIAEDIFIAKEVSMMAVVLVHVRFQSFISCYERDVN